MSADIHALVRVLESIGGQLIGQAVASGVPIDEMGAIQVVGDAERAACARGASPLDLTNAHKRVSPETPCQRGYGMYASQGGTVAKLQGIGRGGSSGVRGIRGNVAEFSKNSRKRLLQTIGSINKNNSSPPLFVGLTYPGVWPDDPAEWMQHLKSFYERLGRKYPWADMSLIWRKEPQKRGAPHFHLFIFGLEFLPWQWVGAVWAEITSGNAATCCRVEKVRSWRGAMSYASKYLAKRPDEDNEHGFTTVEGVPLVQVGRHWGVMGRKHLPVTWERYALSPSEFQWMRRQIARYMRSKGRKHRMRGRSCGVWCFMSSEDVGRLLWHGAPYALPVAEVPKL
jgi:hypothetical protein